MGVQGGKVPWRGLGQSPSGGQIEVSLQLRGRAPDKKFATTEPHQQALSRKKLFINLNVYKISLYKRVDLSEDLQPARSLHQRAHHAIPYNY